MSKYDALATIGTSLMQWGSQYEDRALREQQMANEAMRNERLDALAERRVVNEERTTTAQVSQTELENFRMQIENSALPEKLKLEALKLAAEGNYTKAQTVLAGANAAHIGTTTGILERHGDDQAVANIGNTQSGTLVNVTTADQNIAETEEIPKDSEAERGLLNAQTGALEEATHQSAEVYKNFGLDNAMQESLAKNLANQATRMDMNAKAETIKLAYHEQRLKEFMAGAKLADDGSLEFDEKLYARLAKSKSNGQPAKEVQVAAYLRPGLKDQYPEYSDNQLDMMAIDLATQMVQRSATPSVIEQMIAARADEIDMSNLGPTTNPKIGGEPGRKLGVAEAADMAAITPEQQAQMDGLAKLPQHKDKTPAQLLALTKQRMTGI